MLKVSCVMPTKNRRSFIPAAIDCFMRQTYENRELIITDDGKDSVIDIVDQFKSDGRIRYFRLREELTTGMKRNLTNSKATGTLICHFDDDDWSSDERIEYQVKFLEEKASSITGFSRLLFWDTIHEKALLYRAVVPGYVVGTSFLYYKKLWEGHPFKNIQKASDNDFIYPLTKRTAVSTDSSRMVARIHADHTSGKENIKEVIDKTAIPAAFWENEKLRAQ